MINQKAKDYASRYPVAQQQNIADAWMNGYRTGAAKKSKKELDLSFVSEPFVAVVRKWIEYKAERKQSYTQRGIEACYNNLLQLSNQSPALADDIVNQSMANNYAGLFALKNGKQITNQTTNAQSAGARNEGANKLTECATRILQDIASKLSE